MLIIYIHLAGANIAESHGLVSEKKKLLRSRQQSAQLNLFFLF
jgi:NAD dependent epimerase/dehydratase family enzyme